MQNEKELVEAAVESAAKGAVKGSFEAVPVYQDALQPAAKEIGKSLQTVAKLVNVALAPIKGLVWSYERVEEFSGERLGSKLKDIPPERIITPPPSVAVPAIQSLMLTGGEQTLSEMYANLLATAMDSSTTSAAHPAFVETIRQMTSDEAKLFVILVQNRDSACIRVNSLAADGQGGFQTLIPIFCGLSFNAKCTIPAQEGTYLDNLQRLGLINVSFTEYLTSTAIYNSLQEHRSIKAIEEKIKAGSRPKIRFDRGVISITQYGGQFHASCVVDRAANQR